MAYNINLNSVIKEYNIIPKKKLGQNFIFDKNILEKIIKNILPIEDFNIIEIGPGPGGLTLAILNKKPKKIILIEKDIAFKSILEKILLNNNKNTNSLIIDDFLNLDLNKLIDRKTKILSNLPYYLSSQILIKVLPLHKYVEEVIFTFQKEVAERIISTPNSRKYSRLSVITQAVCNVERKLNLPAEVFYPTPKVSSTVLAFSKRQDSVVDDFDTLKILTRKAFNKRRKKI